MRRCVVLLSLLACRPGKVGGESAAVDSDPEAGLPSPETGDPAPETGESGDSAEEPVVISEEIEGVSWSEGVCQLELTCDGAIGDEAKTRCDLVVQDASGVSAYEGSAGVELRGRSSLGFPKNQYAVELWDADGAAVEAEILDMGAESDWVFNGAWVDRALFRNKLSYDLFQEMGDTLVDGVEYGPESRFCELTLNDRYWGVYVLTERPKRDGSRIDISDAGETDGSSFVLKLEESGGFAPNPLGYGTWTAIYPRQEDASAEALDAVNESLRSWFQAAIGAEGAGELASVVDLDSAVDFVLIEELAKNNDAFFLSVHLWKDTGGLIHFTPWDLDLAYGQPSYNDNENPESWIAYRPTFIAAFGEDAEFRARMAERWVELRAGPLETAALHDRVDGYEALLTEAAARNFERWPIEDVDFSGYLYPVASWDEELGNIHDWLDARLTWMDENVESW